MAFVEDTSECGPRHQPDCDDDCPDCPENFEPRTIPEISDCSERIELWFEIDSERRRANSLHKLDTLIAALRLFRKVLEEEFAEYDRRLRNVAMQDLTPSSLTAFLAAARRRCLELSRCLYRAEPDNRSFKRMLSALVISDIHFIRHRRLRLDVDIELRNGLLAYAPTLQPRFGDFDAILVCGDIAYHAVDNQFAAAASFLRDLQARTGEARVLVVPGNHDIDRDATQSPEQRIWRSRPRRASLTDDERDRELLDLLDDVESAAGLLEPLAAYNRFASAYGCEIASDEPFWTVQLPIDDRYQLQIRGLTSVLISDAYDKNDYLVLGDLQVADLERSPGVVNLTLCHHPYSWLLDGERQRRRLRHRSAAHFTGHEHSHSIDADGETGCLHVRLGALQPSRDSEWAPRVYALGVDIMEEAAAEVRIHLVAARWDPDADRFVGDIDQEFAVRIDPAPGLPAAPLEPQPATRLVRLTERLASLPSGDRLSAADDIGADLGALVDAPSYEFPNALVTWARDQGRLAALWSEVERRHGNQEAGVNPFEGGH